MRGEVSLRVHASRENIARLIQLPAKGIMEIRTSDISNLLIDEAQAYMSKIIQRHNNDELVQDQANENTTIGLCMALRRTVESFGMTIDHSFITWLFFDIVGVSDVEITRPHSDSSLGGQGAH